MNHHFRRLAHVALATVTALVLAGALALLPVVGGAQVSAKQESADEVPAVTAGAAAPPKVSMPDAETVVLLLRTTLLTLNDALQTGNFTVFRDMAAPSFREANSAARLSAIFSNLAQQNVHLTAVAVIVPQLTEVSGVDTMTNTLRLKGFFPGQPVRIDFEVIYQVVAGRWRLFALGVQPTAVVPVGAPNPPAPAPAGKAPEAVPKKKGEPWLAKTEPAKTEPLKK